MKQIFFKKLSISNFRGVEQMTVEFSNFTSISGDNGTGKSSVKNAILWLLTSSDEYDRTNYKLFNEKVKQTKENSKTLSVELSMDIDGTEYVVRKEASVGWTRKKNHSEYERKGSDNYFFYIDGIEKNATDYKAFIEDMICPVEKLKFILNTNYSTLLDWKVLRKNFEDLVGEITDADFEGDYSCIDELLEKYNHNIEDIKAYLRPRINELSKKVGKENTKGELEIQIETLIESLPSIEGLDSVESEIKDAEDQIRLIDEQISGSSKGLQVFVDKRNSEIKEIDRLKLEYASALRAYDKAFDEKVSNLKNELVSVRDSNYVIELENKRLKENMEFFSSSLPTKKEYLKSLEDRRNELLEKNKENKEREFDDYACPFCGQTLPEERIDEKKAEFEEEKEKRHQQIVSEGKFVKSEIEKLSEEIRKIEEKIQNGIELKPTNDTSELVSKIVELRDSFIPYDKTTEGAEKLAEIERKEANKTEVPVVDNSALYNMKKVLLDEIKEKSLMLGSKSAYDSQKSKIEELQKKLRDSACELARLEGMRDAAERYDREKANIVYNRVNKNFSYAEVEMTELNKSGERVDTCRILDENGVDMRVTNTASRVLCGADISISFARKLGITMPLILDDMEKVNENNLPVVDGQLVLLKFDYCDFTIKND